MFYWIVTGRKPFADEDEVHVSAANDEEEAVDNFVRWLLCLEWEDEIPEPYVLEPDKDEDYDLYYINYVIRCGRTTKPEVVRSPGWQKPQE